MSPRPEGETKTERAFLCALGEKYAGIPTLLFGFKKQQLDAYPGPGSSIC